jgi:predicted  nucleic acid-binding Zn-ribbon protein
MQTMLDQLRELQALDSRIDTERDRIATIEASVRDRSEYAVAQRRHAGAVQPLRQLEAAQKDLELKLGTARRQQVEVEQKLYSGKVGSPRELDDLQKRSADLSRQITSGDEALYSLMEQLEQATGAATDAEVTLKRVVAERRTYETDLIAERKALSASVKQAIIDRDQLRTQLDAVVLRQYDRLRSTRGGVAVVEVRQRICLGCRVTLTAAYEQRLRHGDALVTCQSCGRFLYLDS